MCDESSCQSRADRYDGLSFFAGQRVGEHPSQFSATVPSGIMAPGGRWLARCPGDDRPALAVADLDLDATDPDIDVAIRLARPWRRAARAGLYDERIVRADP
jgi:hypothetical protein